MRFNEITIRKPATEVFLEGFPNLVLAEKTSTTTETEQDGLLITEHTASGLIALKSAANDGWKKLDQIMRYMAEHLHSSQECVTCQAISPMGVPLGTISLEYLIFHNFCFYQKVALNPHREIRPFPLTWDQFKSILNTNGFWNYDPSLRESADQSHLLLRALGLSFTMGRWTRDPEFIVESLADHAQAGSGSQYNIKSQQLLYELPYWVKLWSQAVLELSGTTESILVYHTPRLEGEEELSIDKLIRWVEARMKSL